MNIAFRRFSEALEVLYSRQPQDTLGERIGRAVDAAIESDVSAIEVFTRAGEHTERWWASPRALVEQHFPAFLQYIPQHPFFEDFVRTGLRRPVKISDFVSTVELRNRSIYAEFLKPVGIERQMGIALTESPAGVPVLVLGRSGSDYTEADRTMLAALLPIFQDLGAAEAVHRQYQHLCSVLRHTELALVLVENNGTILYATDRARDLMQHYFPAEGDTHQLLPAAVRGWLESSSKTRTAAELLVPCKASGSLKLTVSSDATDGNRMLTLTEETRPEGVLMEQFGITARQAEVLLLVAEGCSNQEIAARLELSRHTIRTQVERLLHSLGVPNRTSAATLAERAVHGRKT